METQDLDLLARFADIVEELTTQELDEAWAIMGSHSKAISKEKIHTLSVGQPVMLHTAYIVSNQAAYIIPLED